MGILDKIIDTQQQQTLQEFEAGLVVEQVLNQLKEREKSILAKRYGLLGHEQTTLKMVGTDQGLTRERVRQIEKELLKTLKRILAEDENFATARELIVNLIAEHGGIMSEERIINFLKIEDESEANSLRFLLHLIAELEPVKKEPALKPAWAQLGFNKDLVSAFIEKAKAFLQRHGQPLSPQEFTEKFPRDTTLSQEIAQLADHVLVNFLHTAAEIEKNVFGEFGLLHWNEIRPRDVGDKAYVVMKHHGQPEHYSIITDLINHHNVDRRTAYKETVHNKLIKDPRFVLVGRGIYALAEWGYQPGVVADIIRAVLAEKGILSRDEIVNEVLKRRLVKKNTVLVGLSNKKLFKKVGKNQYSSV